MFHLRTLVLTTVFLSLTTMALIGYATSLGEVALAHTPLTLASSTSQVKADKEMHPTQIYDFTMDDIDGKPRTLREFKGQVMMIVNTASFCAPRRRTASS